MPRQSRLCIPEYPHHVIQRGNNRQSIFLDNEDRQTFLRKLRLASERYACDIHAYVLMDNHTHFLMTPYTADGISKAMQHIGQCYVRYFNDKYDRTGTLFEGRFKSSVIDADAWLFSCHRYIEMNPVRAGMVKQASEYRWTSHQANAYGRSDPLVTPHRCLLGLASDPAKRMTLYRRMFLAGLPEAEVDRISKSTDHYVPLGNRDFVSRLEQVTGIKLSFRQHGGDRRSPSHAFQGVRVLETAASSPGCKNRGISSALTP